MLHETSQMPGIPAHDAPPGIAPHGTRDEMGREFVIFECGNRKSTMRPNGA